MAKVLVVDDSEFNVKLLAYDLVDQGYDVLTASNGQQAIELSATERPDVILLDVMMPGMDGIETCRRLKADEELRSIPVIMVSAMHCEKDVVRGLDAGAQDYIGKPYSFAMVAARVRSAVRTKTDHDTIEELNRQLDSARKQAEAASLSKSEFLANMSHEIRTPMTAILGFTENLLDTDLTQAQRLSAIATVRRNGEHLLTIINDILDLSKIEAGKLEVERIDCHICETIADVASLMQVRADEKHLLFKVNYVGRVPQKIQTDPTRLRQILINLIGNAIKFTSVGSVRLVVQLLAEGDTSLMQFDVIDTGIGMSREQQTRLFRPFCQADTSTTRKFGGTGLGLTITKRLSQMLGGSIRIVESRENIGTCFRVTIATGSLDGIAMIDDPTVAMTISTEPTVSESAIPQSPLQGYRVLLAEDGPDNQRLISFVVRKAGAEVIVVENGKLAAEAALEQRSKGEPFDAILMDMQMPVLDGYDATRLLRSECYDGIIIALTAHAMAGDRKKCIDAGCDEYAAKPIDRVELVKLIAREVKRREHAERLVIGAAEV